MSFPATGPDGRPLNLLQMNILQNTSYQSNAPKGFESSFGITSTNTDHRKTDYKEHEYCATTLPQPESDELARDGHAECFCTGWFKSKVLSTPGFPSPVVHPPRVTYKVRAAGGHGLGVFATEDIMAGDLIMAERPLLVKMIWNIPGAYKGDVSPEELLRGTYIDMEKSMELICSRMSPDILKKYKSLHNSHATDGSGPLTGIMRTNGFDVGVEDPAGAKLPGGKVGMGRYSCVGSDSSRINHSCSPNSFYGFNMPSFAIGIHAARPIAKGEEITVSYNDIMAPAKERQMSLKSYGFTCTCTACKDPSTWDKERTRVVTNLLPKSKQGVEHAEAVLAAFETTGLQAHARYLDLLNRVANIHRKKGSKERADELESLAGKIAGRRKLGGNESDSPVESHIFTSPEDIAKFIMQRADPTERMNMMKAFMQISNPGTRGNETKVVGPDGKEITVYASDVIPRFSSSS